MKFPDLVLRCYNPSYHHLSSRTGCSDFEGFLTHHQRLKTCSLGTVLLCWGLWAVLPQPPFHELHIWYQSSLCNIKTNVNNKAWPDIAKTYQGQSFPLTLRVLLCLGRPGSPVGLQRLLLYSAVPTAGKHPMGELSQIVATVADRLTAKVINQIEFFAI